MELLDLPDCMLEQILDFCNYDEIAKQRIVSIHLGFFFAFSVACKKFHKDVTIDIGMKSI